MSGRCPPYFVIEMYIPLLKQTIDLGEGESLGLWQPEECPGYAEKCHSSPEECCLSAPIPCSWVEHVLNRVRDVSWNSMWLENVLE